MVAIWMHMHTIIKNVEAYTHLVYACMNIYNAKPASISTTVKI